MNRFARFLSIGVLMSLAMAARPGHACGPFRDHRPPGPGVLFDAALDFAQQNRCEQALPLFLQLRAAEPSWENTTNAAMCLERLGYIDEAADLYEIAVGQSVKDVPRDQLDQIPGILAQYENLVGVLEIRSRYTDLSVWVDGVPRQDRPEPRRLRILPGKHVLKFARNGFEPLEVPIEIEAGAQPVVPVELKPTSGWLRFESEGAGDEQLQIFVDGAPFGYAPWEGSVPPGPHVVWAEGITRGTAPTRIDAERGKIVEIRLQPRPLAEAVFIDPEPAHAAIKFGTVQVAAGPWRARLPHGKYSFEVSAPKYITKRVDVVVPNAQKTVKIRLRLVPPLVKPFVPRPWLEAFGGYAVGPTMGSGAESYCPNACSASYGVHGGGAGLRGGLDLSNGVSIEADLGYLWLGSWLSRTIHDRFGPEQQHLMKYEVDDTLLFRGPTGSIGASYRRRLTKDVFLRGRLHLGAMAAFSRDKMDVVVSAGSESAPANPAKEDPGVFEFEPFVMPELGVESQWDPVEVGLSLGAAIFITSGTSFQHSEPLWTYTERCLDEQSGSLNCATADKIFAGELTHGVFAVLMPRVSIRKKF